MEILKHSDVCKERARISTQGECCWTVAHPPDKNHGLGASSAGKASEDERADGPCAVGVKRPVEPQSDQGQGQRDDDETDTLNPSDNGDAVSNQCHHVGANEDTDQDSSDFEINLVTNDGCKTRVVLQKHLIDMQRSFLFCVDPLAGAVSSFAGMTRRSTHCQRGASVRVCSPAISERHPAVPLSTQNSRGQCKTGDDANEACPVEQVVEELDALTTTAIAGVRCSQQKEICKRYGNRKYKEPIKGMLSVTHKQAACSEQTEDVQHTARSSCRHSPFSSSFRQPHPLRSSCPACSSSSSSTPPPSSPCSCSVCNTVVSSIYYESYVPLALRVLLAISVSARSHFPTVKHISIEHKLGVCKVEEIGKRPNHERIHPHKWKTQLAAPSL
eukprot:GHVT01078923.1.p1 GENE.GHVT01078923.1~~GHVT01078923.1.p1  ORF type:complete len:387 (+),score=39.64 GHVT01078923.1:682-1842(+)